jgi:steroid delta-isomerase-like uncharacterized protein
MKRLLFFQIVIPLLFLSCQSTKEQVLSDEEATSLLNKLMKTVMNVDTTLAEEILHSDCVLRYPVLSEPIIGVDSYKSFIKNNANTFSNFVATIEEVNVKGDRIWSRYSMSGINSGPMGNIPATGKSFNVTGMAITRVKDGKIIEDETYWNVLGFYNQLGFKLQPPKSES